MYSNTKSCVSVNDCFSECFSFRNWCKEGQYYFAVTFLQYILMILNFILTEHNVSGVSFSSAQFDEDIIMLIKLFPLLYARDPVSINESTEELRLSLMLTRMQSCAYLYYNHGGANCPHWFQRIELSTCFIALHRNARFSVFISTKSWYLVCNSVLYKLKKWNPVRLTKEKDRQAYRFIKFTAQSSIL